MTTDQPDTPLPETSIPAGETPVVCPYCGFELTNDQACQLHMGLEHYSELTETEREEFREAYAQEEETLNRFRIIALGGLVALYFGFLVVYALLAV